MIDVYAFVNSEDVADYLRAANYHLTAYQAAYLVNMSVDATLVEKIEAWHAIVDEMPDELVSRKGKIISVHRLIKDHIAGKEKKLDLFMNKIEEGTTYFPYKSRWSKKPSWVPDNWFDVHGLWNTLSMPVPFSSFDKCKAYLESEGEILEHGWHDEGVCYDRHVVCRIDIDEGWHCSYGHINDPEAWSTPQNYVVLNKDFEVLDVAWGWNDHSAIGRSMRAFPIPFQSGDIVIDRTAPVPRPFVFLRPAIPWSEGEDELPCGSGVDYRNYLWDLFDNPDDPNDSPHLLMAVERAYWRRHDWRMAAYGYEVENKTGIIELKDYGACENYLNLEYYNGSLDGGLRQLAIVSENIKGNLDFGAAANFNRLVAMDNRMKAIAE